MHIRSEVLSKHVAIPRSCSSYFPVWPFVCFSSTFNRNIDNNKRKSVPRYVILLYYPFPFSLSDATINSCTFSNCFRQNIHLDLFNCALHQKPCFRCLLCGQLKQKSVLLGEKIYVGSYLCYLLCYFLQEKNWTFLMLCSFNLSVIPIKMWQIMLVGVVL